MNKEVYFMVAFDKKSKAGMVSKSYAAVSRHLGISLYLLHKHEALGPVYETDSFIVYYAMPWVRTNEGDNIKGMGKRY